MLGLIVRLHGERSSRMAFESSQIRVGAANTNDLALCDDEAIAGEHCTLRAAPDEPGAPLQWDVTVHARAMVVRDGEFPLPCDRTTRVADGTRLQLGGYTLELSRDLPKRPLTDVERELLVAIAAGDQQSREIYADWLEQNGEPVKADYVRVQQAIYNTSLDARGKRSAFAAAASRLRELASRLDEGWRRALARPIIEQCDVGMEITCPVDWATLAKTDRADMRTCSACNRHVYYCDTVDLARQHANLGHCVVVDLVQIRKPGDLVDRSNRYYPPMAGAPMPLR